MVTASPVFTSAPPSAAVNQPTNFFSAPAGWKGAVGPAVGDQHRGGLTAASSPVPGRKITV